MCAIIEVAGVGPRREGAGEMTGFWIVLVASLFVIATTHGKKFNSQPFDWGTVLGTDATMTTAFGGAK